MAQGGGRARRRPGEHGMTPPDDVSTEVPDARELRVVSDDRYADWERGAHGASAELLPSVLTCAP
jgi:hypothetical protein